MIIYTYVIALFMYCYWVKKFEDLSTFLTPNDWLLLSKEVDKNFFIFDKVAKLRQKVGEEELAEVTKRLLVRKHEFEFDYTNAQVVGYWRKHMSNWTAIEAEIRKKVIIFRCDKVHKNALFITRCRLAYLDFVDTCRGDYGTRAQKYWKNFAILFQGSNSTNYA